MFSYACMKEPSPQLSTKIRFFVISKNEEISLGMLGNILRVPLMDSKNASKQKPTSEYHLRKAHTNK